MKVMVGWSGPTESNVWHKHDVTITESDFCGWLADNKIDPELFVPRHFVYQVMENMAQQYVTQYLLRRVNSKTHTKTLENLREFEESLLERVKEHVELVESDARLNEKLSAFPGVRS